MCKGGGQTRVSRCAKRQESTLIKRCVKRASFHR